MSSRAGHVAMEDCVQTNANSVVGNGDEHRPLELDMTGQIVKGNL